MKHIYSRAGAYVLLPVAIMLLVTSVQIPRPLRIVDYEDGTTSLYLHRPYVNELAGSLPRPMRLVLLPRHLHAPVALQCTEPCEVYRLLAEGNDNAPFADWESTGIRVQVPGRSCALTQVVRKEFAPGSYELPPGGPLAASPVLVRTGGQISARTIRSDNRFTSLSAAGGWGDFFQLNLHYLAGAGLLTLVNFLFFKYLLPRNLIRSPVDPRNRR